MRKPGLACFCIWFSENNAFLDPAEAHCFAGSGVPSARVRPWQPKGCCHRNGVGLARFFRWLQPTSKMGQIESSMAPKPSPEPGGFFLAAIHHLLFQDPTGTLIGFHITSSSRTHTDQTDI